MDTKSFITPIKRKKSSDLSVIILGSLNIHRSKTLGAMSMLPYRNEPLIENQVRAIREVFPLSEISLVAGYQSTNVINNRPYGVRIIENQLYDSTGNAEEIRLALNSTLNNRVILVSGNVFFDAASLKQMNNHASCILVKEQGNERGDLGTMNNIGKLEIISYGLKNRWCQIALLEEEEIAIIRKFVSKKDKSRYLFHEVINHAVSHGGKINVVRSTVGDIKTLDSAKDL